jgi:hypothetical protein
LSSTAPPFACHFWLRVCSPHQEFLFAVPSRFVPSGAREFRGAQVLNPVCSGLFRLDADRPSQHKGDTSLLAHELLYFPSFDACERPTLVEEHPAMTMQLSRLVAHPASKAFDRSFDDESLVADPRDSVRPAQFVEQKLLSLLKTNAVPVSYTLLRSRASGRSR